METLLPKTATFPVGDATFVSAVGMLPDDGSTNETLGRNVTLPAGDETLPPAGAANPVPAVEPKPVDEMLPAKDDTALEARLMMPSPLKSAATTFPLSASIPESCMDGA